ncbi:DltD domain-containing protein [Neobacillus piezotolerans]|uniref:DltD domain-containing protein n=1 Tax=Neobacillus piezotolerans TaxID=2259171 RepID=A0A3D8GU00_9BACI|nr:DinB family protein [Neobacillus piezotolerans]RDU37915.1 DltD domain-containing protein [Neobacillus piezotolerans]
MINAKDVLAEQLLANSNDPSWYSPFLQSVEQLTEEQAFWKPDEGSFSIAEIVQHLLYWNQTWQIRYQSGNVKAVPPLSSNEESFIIPDNQTFFNLKNQLVDVLLQWQDLVTAEKLESNVEGFSVKAQWWGIIANLTTHNAYHIGQIMYIRKLQKSWPNE